MPLTSQAQAFIDAIAEQNPPGWDEMPPPQGREIFNSFGELFGDGPELLRVEDRTLPSGITLRVFSDHEQPRPVVIYFHGGGWVLGNVETHDPLCRRIAKSSGCTVVSVDYSLAPEAPYPKPFDDCYEATRYVSDNAAELGVDATRLAVAGDSAGGNLAAAVAVRARDENGPAIKLQLLIYPVIEPDFDTESYVQFQEGHGLTRRVMQWFWEQYIGNRTPDAHAAPSLADSHAGLPPAHVITAEYDVLRDEGEAYAQRLSAAGVPTTTKRYDGNLHGFVHFAGAFDDGLRATEDIAEVLSNHLN